MTCPYKTCFSCSKRLPIRNFYRHHQMADGHLNKCKACTKRDVAENRMAKHEYYKNYDRQRANRPDRVAARKAYDQSPRGRAASRRAFQWQNLVSPEKRKARILVGNAIRAGELMKQPCEKCGATKVEAHHDDYSKPLDVRWLCNKHHREHHAVLKKRAA